MAWFGFTNIDQENEKIKNSDFDMILKLSKATTQGNNCDYELVDNKNNPFYLNFPNMHLELGDIVKLRSV